MIPFGSVLGERCGHCTGAIGSPENVQPPDEAGDHKARIQNPVTKLQPYTRPEYNIDEESDVTETSVHVDSTDVMGHDYAYVHIYLIGTLHLNPEDMEYYKFMGVVEETFDESEGPLIVSYRRHVTKTSQMQPKTDDDGYSIHILG